MRSMYALFIYSLALRCACDDAPTCTTTADVDGEDDRCQLLQGTAGVVNRHGTADNHAEAKADVHGPDDGVLKKAASAFGSADDELVGGEVEKDFVMLEAAVVIFHRDVKKAVKELVSTVKVVKGATSSKDATGIESIIAQVKAAFTAIHHSVLKLRNAFKKTATDFANGNGKGVPASLKSVVDGALEKSIAAADVLANAFKKATKGSAEDKGMCSHVKTELADIKKTATAFVESTKGLTQEALSGGLTKAHGDLPAVMKLLMEADAAAKQLQKSMSPVVQEITDGVAAAIKDHCTGPSETGAGGSKSGTGRLEVGLLSAFVVAALIGM